MTGKCGTSAAGAASNPATISFPGPTRIREGDGSPVSRAAAAAAAVAEAVAAEEAVVEDEAALQATTTESKKAHGASDFVKLKKYLFFFNVVYIEKKTLKIPRPECNYHCCGYK
jgi:hypothetical protein